MSEVSQHFLNNPFPKAQDRDGNTAFHRACMIDWVLVLSKSAVDLEEFTTFCSAFVEILVCFRSIGFSFNEVHLEGGFFFGIKERCTLLLSDKEKFMQDWHPTDILLNNALQYKELKEELYRYEDYHSAGLHEMEFQEEATNV